MVKNIPMSFSKEQLDFIGTISPDVYQLISKAKQQISEKEKIEKLKIRKELHDAFIDRKNQVDEYCKKLILDWQNIPSELERYDLLTYHYIGIINKLPGFCQEILYYFGEYPMVLPPKQIIHLVDKKKSTAISSNYLRRLVNDGLLEVSEGSYYIKDPHFQKFLVMRYNRRFNKHLRVFKSKISIQCISNFIKSYQFQFKKSIEKKTHLT